MRGRGAGPGWGWPALHKHSLGFKISIRFFSLFKGIILTNPTPPGGLGCWLPWAHLCGSAPRYVTGWFGPYHRRRKLIHPVMVQHIQPPALRLATPLPVATPGPPQGCTSFGYCFKPRQAL